MIVLLSLFLSGVEGAFDAPGAKTVIPKKVFIFCFLHPKANLHFISCYLILFSIYLGEKPFTLLADFQGAVSIKSYNNYLIKHLKTT